MHQALREVDRATRRRCLRAEAQARKDGAWGEWETLTFPRGNAGRGWAADFTTAHRNRVFSVLDRTLPDGVRHLAISSLSGIRPSWHEMQRIKNDIAGCDMTAVEVYPPAAEIVDGADMFHIWVLPQPLSFSLHRSQIAQEDTEHGECLAL
jgi:hypothetical protein